MRNKISIFIPMLLISANTFCQINDSDSFQTISMKDSSFRIPSLDSLKWIIYSLNFEQTLAPVGRSTSPNLKIVECDTRVRSVERISSDSIVLYFSFFKENETASYAPVSTYNYGIGFTSQGKMFLVLSTVFPRYTGEEYLTKAKLLEYDHSFRKYLNGYYGVMVPWLSNEIKRRTPQRVL